MPCRGSVHYLHRPPSNHLQAEVPKQGGCRAPPGYRNEDQCANDDARASPNEETKHMHLFGVKESIGKH